MQSQKNICIKTLSVVTLQGNAYHTFFPTVSQFSRQPYITQQNSAVTRGK